MEVYVFRAGGVLENGENGSHGATDVGGVEGHCHMDCIIGTYAGFMTVTFSVVVVDGRAVRGVVELRGFSELVSRSMNGQKVDDPTKEEEEAEKRCSCRHGLENLKKSIGFSGLLREGEGAALPSSAWL